MGIKLRKAKLSDASAIGKILADGYRISSAKEGMLVFKEEMKTGHHYLVADDNGKLVGIIVWRRIGLPKHQLGKIMRFHVLPKYEAVRETMFRDAIQALDKEYRKRKQHLRKIYIYVHSTNKEMQQFFKKIGLVHEATLKDHFYKGVDEYVFSMFFE